MFNGAVPCLSRARVIDRAKCSQGTTLSQFKKKGDSEPKRAMTVGSGWSVQRSGRAGDGFVLTAPGRVTKLRASSEQEEAEVICCSVDREKRRLFPFLLPLPPPPGPLCARKCRPGMTAQ